MRLGEKLTGTVVVVVILVLALVLLQPGHTFRLPWHTDEGDDERITVEITVTFTPNRADLHPVRVVIETGDLPPERKSVVVSPFHRRVITTRGTEVHVRAQQGVNEFLQCLVIARDRTGNEISRDARDRRSAGAVHCYYNRSTFLDPDW